MLYFWLDPTPLLGTPGKKNPCFIYNINYVQGFSGPRLMIIWTIRPFVSKVEEKQKQNVLVMISHVPRWRR